MLHHLIQRAAFAALAFGVAGLCVGQDVPSFAIRTIAGADAVVDGQSLGRAPLFGASRLAFDASGNLYIAECSGNRIRKAAGGRVSTYAGNGFTGFSGDGGPAVGARLSCPMSLVLDATGNLYFVDGGERIRRVTPNGVITTYVPPAGAQYADSNLVVWGPTALSADGAGNLYFSVAHMIRKVGQDGQVARVAGGATAGFGGDEGLAGAAQLNSPSDLAFDATGNLFIADSGNNRIRKIARDGTITTIAGSGQRGNTGDGGPATEAQISNPAAITFDGGGNLFISSGSQLRKVTPAGLIATFSSYWSGQGLAFDSSDGYFYYISGGQILGKGPGESTGILVDGPRPPGTGLSAASAIVMSPAGLAADAAGNIFYVDTSFRSLTEITPSGSVGVAVAFNNSGTAVAVSPSGDVYYVDGSQVFKLDRRTGRGVVVAGQLQPGSGGDGGPAVAAQLRNPRALTLDPAGNLYIADSSDYRIRKVATSGIISTIAGAGVAGDSGDGGPALAARFRSLTCLTTDSSGALYVCDSNRIRKIDATGTVNTIAGLASTGGFSRDGLLADGSPLMSPIGVAVDAKGDIYVAESQPHRLRVIARDGRLHTVAGTTVAGFEGDGGLARDAKLYAPSGLAIDTAGNLYVSDLGNHRIRKLTLNEPRQLQIVGGDAQTGPPGGCLKPLQARITGSAAVGVPGLRVDFTVVQGSASVAASAVTGSDGVAAAAIALGAGPGAVDVRASSAGVSPATFHLTAQAGGNARTPCIVPGGVVAAGLSPTLLRSLSPGALATAFGQNFTDPDAEHGVTSADIQAGNLPTRLTGVCVMLGGVAAPLLYVGQGQINFQVPDTALSDSVSVQVLRNCGSADELRSNREIVTVRAASPELLALAHYAEGGNPVAAIDALDQTLIADPSSLPGQVVRAAKTGDVLTLFAIGLGRTDPPLAPGALAGSAASLTSDAHVEIQGWELEPADVLYAGVTPGFAGLYQISIRIPKRFASFYGCAAIAVRVGNVLSPTGTYLFITR